MVNCIGQIYLTINLLNNKIYIGQTCAKDPHYLGSGVLLKKDIKKYGKRSFKKIILKDNIVSQEELNSLEKFYIAHYSSCDLSIGYNIRIGGENKGFKHTQEAINKIKTRSQKEDNKKRIREIQKLSILTKLGTKTLYNSKVKGMISRQGKLNIIYIYNLNMDLFNTCNFISEASNITGVSTSSIKNNLYGLSKTTRKYIFKFKS